MGEATLLIADLIVKAESISIGKKKAHEGLLHLPLQPKFVPGDKKGKSNKITGQLVIHYTFPPIKHVREASEKSLLSLKTITGRDVFKVSASGSVGVQTFYELPPFLYDSSGFSINNAMWFANLCQLAYKKPDVILTTGPALFSLFLSLFFLFFSLFFLPPPSPFLFSYSSFYHSPRTLTLSSRPSFSSLPLRKYIYYEGR